MEEKGKDYDEDSNHNGFVNHYKEFIYFIIFFRRFTREIAQTAEHVVAVDFMKDFIEKNEEDNKHLGNIEFLCADVTQLTRPKER
jgi:hypothetical protein